MGAATVGGVAPVQVVADGPPVQGKASLFYGGIWILDLDVPMINVCPPCAAPSRRNGYIRTDYYDVWNEPRYSD